MTMTPSPSLREAVRAHRCMVATGHPLAAAAALNLLREGGSAVDAAIGADAVLGVVEPMATSIGGDLLAMLVPAQGPAHCYNGTGRAPAALSPEQVARLPGARIPERHAYSVTTPGVVRGWHDLHQRHGRLDWPRLFTAAIEAAQQGFPVAPVAAREWALFEPVLRADLHCAALYRAGRTPRAGERFSNPELAAVLRAIAEGGWQAFYHGAVANAVARASQERGGLLSTEDLAAHSGNFDEPLSASFRGLQVLECPPNTHGVAVLDALRAIESLDLDTNRPRAMAQLVDAMAEAMANARRTVADPSGNTVCTVVVDGDGLAVTLMSSIFKRFGSGIAVPGCGFVLQNRGFGFAGLDHINGPAGGKRPFHTVVPGAALRDGRFHAAFGVVGGLMQPQGHLQLLLRLAAWQQPLQQAIDAPRWRLEPDNRLAVEAGMPDDFTKALRAAGYAEPAAGAGELAGRSDFGGAQVVLREEDGRLAGGTDPRKDGMACGD
ncbi:gamma-glutamyltransferase family protein [Variovorax terrae]|uniref:Gamma-glutamyltransferase family protein n=1 Tax=Variovorax terrae TaxID=2923278 RepID=A0A9X1VWC3_9BURK|nr:gamma-glutamyltransferase [Variovorax terrae]MCJ0764440.1 gamma-glutamyltransferase family protein [Variovorax terrae]